ncbi:MAG: tandem-95 repeat protein [Pseudonocardiales bacterium]|nr:tandem-95 repeat protein [Pseudonocardiales bacterium]
MLFATSAGASPGQTVTDLNSTTANDLVSQIVGSGITTSNVVYTGDPAAAGKFSGFAPLGFASGITLSSGRVADAVGPNDDAGKTTEFTTPGDSDLDAIIAPNSTLDASVLTFDFVPTTTQLTFDYVFSSEEYNEFANTQYNDVFAFLVNGKNCALTPDGDPVSINTINGGNPLGTGASHPELYRNNDDGNLALQADGLTVVMHCVATVNKNVTNTLKLAIADASDRRLDSTVFIRAGSVKANNPPTADNKSVTTAQDTAVAVTLTGADPDNDPLTFAVATGPTHGSLSGTGANLTYTPTAGYSGPDSFTYTTNDGAASSAPATVSITVTPKTPTNHPPVADSKSVSTLQNTPVAVTLSGSDPDNDPITFAVATAPAHGTLSGTGANLTYTPAAGYSGPDSFTYTTNDGKVSSTPATVSITVTQTPPVNHPPTADSKSYNTNQDTAVAVTLTGSDPDNNPLTFSVATQPSNGTLTGTGANLTYHPNPGYFGFDSFTYTANDGQLTSPPATVSIVIKPVTTCTPTTPSVDTKVYANAKAVSKLVAPKLTTVGKNELLVAFIEAAGPASKPQTVTSVTGGGLIWKLAARSNAIGGSTEIWTTYATVKLTNVVVTAALAKTGYDGSITVTAFKGAAKTIGTTATGYGVATVPSINIKAKASGSVIWSAGHGWGTTTAATANTGQTVVHQFVDAAQYRTFWTQSVNAPTVAGQTVTVGDKAPTKDRWTYAAVEITGIGCS